MRCAQNSCVGLRLLGIISFEPYPPRQFVLFAIWNAGMIPNDLAASMVHGGLRMESSAEHGEAETQK